MAYHCIRTRVRLGGALALICVGKLAAEAILGESNPISHKELSCLTANIYHEARGEPARGQRAVADVTLNRVDDPRWPDTICAVVYQNRQFSWTQDTLSDELSRVHSAMLAEVVARDAVLSEARTTDATHYHADYVSPDWATRLEKVLEIGRHIFYR